ncbi:MAG: hypothetical protein QI199_04845 [Candidatus Korarchaeota archaeon]|nr:hypothetical protein [Candidatus Korarchaeota archaeon]
MVVPSLSKIEMDYESFLIKVEMYAYLDPKDLEGLISKLVEEMEKLGFLPSRRAEGYAFLPMGSPVPTHLRLGVYTGMVTFWVRGAGEVAKSADRLRMSADEFFESILSGIRKAGEIFSSYEDRGSVRVFMPELE